MQLLGDVHLEISLAAERVNLSKEPFGSILEHGDKRILNTLVTMPEETVHDTFLRCKVSYQA